MLLKLSGAVFGGGKLGVDPDVVRDIARQLAEVVGHGTQMAIVVGGGNFFRGAELSMAGMERARADYMGMLGTVMNCLALQDFLEKAGVETRVQTAITMGQIAEPYIPRRAIRHLEKGRVVIFGGGAGHARTSRRTRPPPNVRWRSRPRSCSWPRASTACTTPTRAPTRTPGSSTRSPTRTCSGCGLKVADATAFSLCMDNNLPIVVFNLLETGGIARAVAGEKIGTIVSGDA